MVSSSSTLRPAASAPEADAPVAAPDTTPALDRRGALIAPPDEIFRSDDVIAALADVLDDGPAADQRAKVVAVLRPAYGAGVDAIRTRFGEDPQSGRAVCRSMAYLTDEMIRVVVEVTLRWLHPVPNPTAAERLAVVAVGGYGRFEMAPFSDIDLLFLTPYKQTPWSESFIESVLYILWDLRLKVGHSVRTIEECLRQAKADVTVRTAVLEHRYITGDVSMAQDLGERLWKELFRRTGPEFVEAKLAERDDRHSRHGASRFLLEPNIKESKGGLRDLQNLYWIAKYLYSAETPADLVDKGVFTPSELLVFEKAESFLWTVRCHLHFLSNRGNEQLTFDMQIEIAARMGFADAEGKRGVEHFMQAYFTHAKKVGELTRIFIAALEARHVKHRPVLSSILRVFSGPEEEAEGVGPRMSGGRLTVGDVDWFGRDPINLLRILDEARRTGARMHPDALRMIAGNLRLVDDGMRANPQAHALFLELLTADEPSRSLRRMNETGFLGAFLPEWDRIVGLMQFNMYHHYTVDEHTIHALETLSEIERGALVEDLPVASEILNLGLDRLTLRLALLLHDIGKGRPEDHSVIGAELAETICARLGLDQATSNTVVWLVRHHLLLADVAQKRDISDPATVREFADLVRSPDRLKLLLVLTVCDIRAVGPGVWNNWKAQLLRKLYWDTRDHLTAGAELPSHGQRVEEAQARLRKALKGWKAADVEAEIDRHYAQFWLGLDAETQTTFARIAHRKSRNPVESAIADDPDRDATRACFYLEDHPGIFARLSGALAVAGANVVDARSFTSRDGFACAAFWIQAPDGAPYDSAKLPGLKKTIGKILSGQVVTKDALIPKRRLKKREGGFRVPTRVVFDNKSSDLFTVIEVEARDRVGLLYDLTRAIAACNVSISSAIITTYGEQAVDVFYVKDLFGLKIRGQGKMKAIEAKLKQAIDASAPDQTR